jgi:hypothetical protein
MKDKLMTVENFLNDINEKTWKNNISSEVSRHLDKIIEYLEENRDAIVEEVSSDIDRIESVKNEDSQLFTYADSQKWIEYYVKECIKGIL